MPNKLTRAQLADKRIQQGAENVKAWEETRRLSGTPERFDRALLIQFAFLTAGRSWKRALLQSLSDCQSDKAYIRNRLAETVRPKGKTDAGLQV